MAYDIELMSIGSDSYSMLESVAASMNAIQKQFRFFSHRDRTATSRPRVSQGNIPDAGNLGLPPKTPQRFWWQSAVHYRFRQRVARVTKTGKPFWFALG
jgi:hypothetical protein